MNTYKLKHMARTLVLQGKISKTSAKKIQNLLPAHDLALLSSYIRTEQDKQTVRVTTADTLDQQTTKTISNIFQGKKVVTTIDKKIGAGVKAQVYDMIYDLTVKSKISNLIDKLGEEI